MRNFIPAIMIPVVCMTLAGETTGRIVGKVVGKDGKPVLTAQVSVSRLDINLTKELKLSDKGTFSQVGLEPKEYRLKVVAEGYVTFTEDVKIPLGDFVTRNVTLLTTKEAQEEAVKSGQASMAPGEAKALAGSTAFNSGVEFYNQQKFAEALPFLEKSVGDLREAVATSKEDAKKTNETQLATAERVYGVTLFEVGKSDPSKKDLLVKAQPLLTAAYELNPKDNRTLMALFETSKALNDKAGIAKYQAAVDAIIGPRPEMAYNDGVTAFNDGKFKEAKVLVTKAIGIDPKYPDSYWLLGVVEYSLNDTKAAKEAFKKYLELAPTGKKAGEVKEFLKAL
jgi:tetratricopeptide (TPR) repeat protein